MKKSDILTLNLQEEAEPDEDGWVTVSRHTGRKPVVTRSLKAQVFYLSQQKFKKVMQPYFIIIKQARLKAVAERKRKKKELSNFYKFQMKEEKIKRIDDLRSKFEADKEKQLKMKQDRKFKPY